VDKTVILFNRASGAQQAVMTGHTKKVLDVGFSLNGEFLLSSSADGTAKVLGLLYTINYHCLLEWIVLHYKYEVIMLDSAATASTY
jgi:WD40 repeat protein